MEFKTFEFANRHDDSVLIFSEQTEEDAEMKLKRIVKNPSLWRLDNIIEE